jgi:hypothetical protein
MLNQSLDYLRQAIDTTKAEVVDARSQGGEVIFIPLTGGLLPVKALELVADNLSMFMEAVTGRGYAKAEEVYDLGYTVREPGHQAYGLKVHMDGTNVVISRISILEDETIFHRYVNYLKTGVLV